LSSRSPKIWRAIGALIRPRPAVPPPGYYKGWPRWRRRACLVHKWLFGWAYILMPGTGAILRFAMQ
jgi:hypothetical protein